MKGTEKPKKRHGRSSNRGLQRAQKSEKGHNATQRNNSEGIKKRIIKKEHTKQGETGNGISRGIMDKCRRPEHRHRT